MYVSIFMKDRREMKVVGWLDVVVVFLDIPNLQEKARVSLCILIKVVNVFEAAM